MLYKNLTRPLVVFDLETTGVDLAKDRIVEIALIRIEMDSEKRMFQSRINPERPIPEGATAVHGISDADVRDKPTFKELAPDLLEMFSGCDLAGYNIANFDIPLLVEEFARCGFHWHPKYARILDGYKIFCMHRPRTLGAAVQHYLGREHENAHSALADVEATLDILTAQVQYEDVGTDLAVIHETYFGTEQIVDYHGKLVMKDGKLCYNFGKHKGAAVRDEPGFGQWMLGQDFIAESTKYIVGNELSLTQRLHRR